MKQADISVELIDYMGDDLSVVNAARVSFDKEASYSDFDGASLPERDQKLINYLAKHNHWSPFAHTSLQFRIKAPIFVARQLGKHQVGLVWNEVSRRYVDDEPEFYIPKEWRGRPENAKQGSSGVVDADCEAFNNVVGHCLWMYEDLLKDGVAPEQARMVLPQNTMTSWIWTGSLMAFARVYKQRIDPHAQYESQIVAKLINDNIPRLFKHSWKALTE